MTTVREGKDRKNLWKGKGKTIAQIMEAFFTLATRTHELNQKVKDIRFINTRLHHSSITFLEKSFSFLEDHLNYLEENKKQEVVKEFQDDLEDLLYKVSKTREFVDAIHIPPLPSTTYSFKDLVSFLTMVEEKPVDTEFAHRNPEYACARHVKYFYNRYMKKDCEVLDEDEEKSSPTHFSPEELTVLCRLAEKVRYSLGEDCGGNFLSCMPPDIRDFVAALSLQGEVWDDDKTVKRIYKALEILDEDVCKFRNVFRKFVKHMIPIPYIEEKKKGSKHEKDD